MSISGNLSMTILRMISGLSGLSGKKMRITSMEEEIRKGKEISEKNPFVLPKDKKARYKEIQICGYPCLVMRNKKQKGAAKSAILYLHGGIQNIWKPEISIARGYMNQTDTDVWYPIYPSATEVPIMESIRVCFETYRRMAKKYGAEHIAIVGGSFGGYFALQIINRINVLKAETVVKANADSKLDVDNKPDTDSKMETAIKAKKAVKAETNVAMPGLVIALSPGGVPDDEESLRKMEKLAKGDPIINMAAVLQTKDLARWYDAETPDYAIYPALENFSNAPETYLYYGEETLAGNADCYSLAFQKSGCADKLHVHIQPGMMHCYACMPIFPECKEAYKEQIELIKKYTD